MIKEAIINLTAKNDLNFNETKEVFEEILSGKTTPAQIAAFLIALKMKGETTEEVLAAVLAVREKAIKISVRQDFLGVTNKEEPIFDSCGTGGSGSHKFNISTVTAFVVAASGVIVAKHGNRGVSSSCGSADLLEALGIKIDLEPRLTQEVIKKTGIGFLFAPLYHPAFKEVALVRKEIGVRTIFNILGPLCNPAGTTHQLIGVFHQDLAGLIAKVLSKIGIKKAFVVYGKDVKDEISLTGPTQVYYVNQKKIENFIIKPSDFGLKKTTLENIKVDSPGQSAKIALSIFDGKASPYRDAVLANASACFYILGKVDNFKQGVALAAELIDKGSVKNKYLEFKSFIEKISS